MVWMVMGGAAAFALGIWIGLGHPGYEGREDRVLPTNMRRRSLNKAQFLDWWRPKKR